jgi:hypothetical protein
VFVFLRITTSYEQCKGEPHAELYTSQEKCAQRDDFRTSDFSTLTARCSKKWIMCKLRVWFCFHYLEKNYLPTLTRNEIHSKCHQKVHMYLRKLSVIFVSFWPNFLTYRKVFFIPLFQILLKFICQTSRCCIRTYIETDRQTGRQAGRQM